jgi:hypothetical protein
MSVVHQHETQQGAIALAYRHELTVEELAGQVKKIHEVMAKLMKPETHFGVIPGTKKPTLYKPGAELLNMLFRLDPQYGTEEIRDGDHLIVRSTCTLWHIPTGQRMGSGMGSCSTREAKYAYRRSGRTCPSCGKEDTIIKGKAEFGGGWLCFGKRGGCGAKFKDGDDAIEQQQTEQRVANPDLPDTHNTVLKMSNKRALVAAVLNVTAASEIFTQDVDDKDERDRDDEDEDRPSRREAPSSRGQGVPQQEHRTDPDIVINENQHKRLRAIATGTKWSDDQLHELLSGYQYNSPRDVKIKDYETLCEKLKQGPDKGLSKPGQQQGTLA